MELVGEGAMPHKPLKEPKIGDVNRFANLGELESEGFTAYVLGPVYVYAGVEESIPERFAAEPVKNRPPDVSGSWFEFSHAVIARCEHWNYRMEYMDTKSYEYFRIWMLGQVFINRPKRNVYVPRRYLAPVLDPFAFCNNIGKPTSIEVYSVSNLDYLLRPKCELPSFESAKFFVDFEKRPPEPDVLELGKALLESVG
jgi:hypothetical protein